MHSQDPLPEMEPLVVDPFDNVSRMYESVLPLTRRNTSLHLEVCPPENLL